MQPVPPEHLPAERKLTGHAAHADALDELISHAAHVVRIFDRTAGPDFNSARRCELLRKLLLASRNNRVYIVLHDASTVARDCPRLMLVLKQFSHSVFIHQTLQAAKRVYDPFSVADEARFVRRFHYARSEGTAAVGDVAATQLLLKRFQEIWQASAQAVTATRLGL